MDKYVGKRLDGRYEIQDIIGVGGMAVVYKAYDNVENRTVAIKILKEEFSKNEEFLRRFKNESKAISLLSHSNIVKVYDVSFGDLIQYIVMEYIDGITLKQYIEQEGSLPWKDAVHFIIQVLRGIQHAHDRGIVHRDIKPQNIMVLRDGTIKVTDFGIARFARSEQKTITDKAIGSVHYISPEQARGETTDEKADVYSVGVILYEMITGQLPFQAESAVSVAIMQLQREPSLPSEINGSIPQGLEQITMHAMQKDSGKRYKSAAEMLCDLDTFRKDPAVTFDYAYFVDDSPTKFIASINDATLDEQVVEDDDDDDGDERTSIIPILAGVAGAVVVAAIVLLVVFWGRLFGETGDAVECPTFIGMTYEEILENPEYDDYNITPMWDYDSETEKGKVFKQDPQAGEKLKAKKNVTIYISQGQETINVPDVYGMSASMAETQLKAYELQVKIEEVYNEDVDIGTVIKTSPARSTAVYPNDEVIMYVSLGAEAFNVDLPSVVNMNKEEAVEYLENLGFTVELDEADSTKPKGIVIAQSPSTADTKQVPMGSVINLTISTGIMNYECEIVVDLPKDYVSPTGTVSLWADGQMLPGQESSIIEFSQVSEYKFTVKTIEKSMTLNVRLSENNKSYSDYLTLQVDSSTGKYSIKETHDYPKAEVSSETTNSSETTSSEESTEN